MFEIYLIGIGTVILYLLYADKEENNKEILTIAIIWPWVILRSLESYVIFYCEDYYDKLELPKSLETFLNTLRIKIRSWFI